MPSGLGLPVPQVAAGVLVIFLNGFTLWIFKKTKSVKTTTKYLIAYLACSDICLGLCYVIRAALILSSLLTQNACAVLLDVILMSAGGSLTAIFLMYIEVFLSVKFALKFQLWVSKKKTLTLIGLTLVFWACVGVGGYFLGGPVNLEENLRYSEENCSVFSAFRSSFLNTICFGYVAMFLIIMGCQIGVIIVLRKHQAPKGPNSNTPYSLEGALRPISTIQRNGPAANPADVASQTKTCIRKEVKITKLITAVLLLFCLCWYPYIIALLVYNLCPGHCGVQPDLLSSLGVLILLHGVFNFIAYVAKCKEFRRALQLALCSRCIRNKVKSDLRAADSGSLHLS